MNTTRDTFKGPRVSHISDWKDEGKNQWGPHVAEGESNFPKRS